ncbi:MAG: FISUMP domain-containing protein [Bacteroidota bacterium]
MKNFSKKLFVLFISLGLLFSGCKDEGSEVAPEGSPEVVTTPVSEITHNSALSGGTVIEEGLSEVSVQGIVWSTSSGPTIDQNEGFTADDSSNGDFNSNLYELATETEYFVRAYATNDEGTAYGKEEAFTTTVYDPEAVTIGDQEWTLKNLSVSLFQNGDSIPHVKSVEEWEKAGKEGTPAWCYYENDPANGALYGKLYNWHAVVDTRGIAPEGWHVPSFEEWKELREYLGGEDVAGKKLKSTSDWYDEGNGTNESGFTALPARYRELGGEFAFGSELGADARFWTTSTGMWDDPFAIRLYAKYDRMQITDQGKGNGYSVRLVKD